MSAPAAAGLVDVIDVRETYNEDQVLQSRMYFRGTDTPITELFDWIESLTILESFCSLHNIPPDRVRILLNRIKQIFY